MSQSQLPPWNSLPATADEENMRAEFERFLRSFYSSFASYATDKSEFVAREAFMWAWNAKNEEWQDE